MTKTFSIIICCFNSELVIKKTLLHINSLNLLKHFKIEILLINNNSTDNTVTVSRDLWDSLGSDWPLYIFDETNKGLTFARICGVLNSNFEYLIFCDDDNYLNPDYLIEVDRIFSNSTCKIVGALGIPLSDKILSPWFFEFGQSAYAVGDYGRQKGFGNLTYGAGMAIRRNVAVKWTELKNCLFLTDRKGKDLSSGGDTELCLIVGLNHIYYNPNLKFYHYLGKRVNEKHFLRLNLAFGKAESLLFYYSISEISFFKSFIFFLFEILKSFKKVYSLYFLRKKNLLLNAKFNFYKEYLFGLIKSIFWFRKNYFKAKSNLSYLKS